MQFLQAFIVLVLLSFTRAAAIPESNIAIPERDLTLLSPTKRDMNVSTVMSNFQVVIMASSSLNNIVSSMSDSMSIDTVTTMGTTIVTDFTTIIGSLATDLAEMGETVFDDAAAGQIVPVLLEFVKIHCALLSTLIGKNGIFRQFLLTAPIAVVLKTLETGIDAFADGLINMIPTQGSVVQSGQAMLDVSVTNAITVYNVACTPVFPIIGQICVNLPI